nr:MAG TPA: R3H domain [Caudoviricetes sp.]
MVLCGLSGNFSPLSPCIRQVIHALLTRPPLSLLKFHPKTSF